MHTGKDKEGYETFEGPKGHTVGGTAQAVYCFSLNMGKLEWIGAFFPGKTRKLWLVRGTISFYKPEIANFSCWRKCYVEWINASK